MAGILHIETSTEVCSVAVSKDGFMVFEREDREHHADGLGTFIDEAMDAAKVTIADANAAVNISLGK